MDRCAQILDLCARWQGAATQGGGLQLDQNSEQFRLRNNGILPHDMSLLELRTAHVSLAGIIRQMGYGAVIDRDHLNLWAWEADLLVGTHNGWPRFFHDRTFASAFETMMHVLFARPDLAAAQAEPHGAQVLANLGTASEFWVVLCFPLLESLLKRRAATYVTEDGVVVAAFEVPRANRPPRRYAVGDQVSSLRDLLYLEHDRISDADLKADVAAMVAGLTALEPDLQHGFDVIYRWRNSTLHGGGRYPTVGGTVISLILRILVSELPDFDAYSQRGGDQRLQSASGVASDSVELLSPVVAANGHRVLQPAG